MHLKTENYKTDWVEVRNDHLCVNYLRNSVIRWKIILFCCKNRGEATCCMISQTLSAHEKHPWTPTSRVTSSRDPAEWKTRRSSRPLYIKTWEKHSNKMLHVGHKTLIVLRRLWACVCERQREEGGNNVIRWQLAAESCNQPTLREDVKNLESE